MENREIKAQFYRALVLDYPNAEDRWRFRLAQKSGTITPTSRIGGQIEIHGRENELMAQTLGCIMLDNADMATLFAQVSIGTPVTTPTAKLIKNKVFLQCHGTGCRIYCSLSGH